MIASKLKPHGDNSQLSLPPPAIKTRATAEVRSKKGHSYKPLPVEFRADGFNYRQIAREGEWAIYEQTWSGCSDPSVSYEVIRIRRREGFQIDGRLVEPAEVYPKSEAWGVDGFTFTDRDAAFAKLREMARTSATVTSTARKTPSYARRSMRQSCACRCHNSCVG
jgi:hypothetical protein